MPPRPALPARHRPTARIGRAARNVATLIEAGAMLAAASAAIRWLPFRRVMAAAGWRGVTSPPDDAAGSALRVRWAVERLAEVVPWRAVCFQRGLAAQWMLRRRGIPSFLHYGVDGRAPDGISAHVWIMLDGLPLLGGAESARHACVMIRPDAAR